MTLDPITTSGPTITVSTSEELTNAYELLSFQEGGGTILLEGGSYGEFTISTSGGVDGTEPVIIASVDDADPAMFEGIGLTGVSDIRIENVLFDSTGSSRADYLKDLMISDSTNIQIVDSVFQYDADNALKDADDNGPGMSLIRDSSDILLEGNYIDGYFHGIGALEVDTLEIVGNEFTNLQGDGFRGGGLQNLLIEGNYMHGFYGSDNSLNHDDLIQLWGTAADTLTTNVTITGNILITEGVASQSIFIRNEAFGQGSDATSGYFENITITDNLIYNAHKHGIRVDDTDGVYVDGNTLLFNPEAAMYVNGVPHVSEPTIYLLKSIDLTVTDNITSAVYAPDGSTVSGNVIVDYDNPAHLNYVGSHFVNPFAGAGVTPEDLYMLPDSPWFGSFGSSIGNTPDDFSNGAHAVIVVTAAADDSYHVTLDASQSVDDDGQPLAGPGYSYHWTFADGTTAEGQVLTKMFENGGFESVDLEIRLDGETVADITRSVPVETKDIFAFDFENGVADISGNEAEIIDEGTLTPSHDGTGYRIGDGNKLELGRATDGMYSVDRFALALDMTPTDDEQSGVFLHLNGAMTGSVSEEGHVVFQLTTDEGTYELISREPIFEDGGTHRIGISYDGEAGQLEIFADGESVSVTEAWGTTAPPVYFNMVFGNTWDDSMDVIVDNVVMSADPAVASKALGEEPPAEDPPAEDPPAEDPPAEDPPAEDPPAEDPPAEDPPAEDPPAEDPPAEDPPAEDPPAEDPPAEDPPAEDPPAEDPPAEEPPAEEPPAEDPPTEEEDPRGQPKEAVASGDGGNFLSKIFDMFLKIFGGGGKGNKATEDTTTEEAEATYDTTLADIMPVTEMLEDDVVATEEDDEFTDLAA